MEASAGFYDRDEVRITADAEVRSSGGGDVPSKRRGQVASEFEELAKATEVLDRLLATLEERLGPVLGPLGPDKASPDKPAPVAAPMAEHLRRVRSQVMV